MIGGRDFNESEFNAPLRPNANPVGIQADRICDGH
jgi:hypothetical protein